MYSCLYCGHPTDTYSKEHVISAAFGCKEQLVGQVCKHCNETFGHKLEAQFANGLLLFLNTFKIPGREGKVPDLKCKGTVDGMPREIIYTGDGHVIIQPHTLATDRTGPRMERVYRTFKRGQESIIENNLRSRHREVKFERLDRLPATGKVEVQHEFDASVLCRAETNQTIAKYALNLLTFIWGQAFVQHRFRELRDQINGSRKDSTPVAGVVWKPDLLRRVQAHPPQHVVILFANGQTHEVVVFIYLFSLFPFCVIARDPMVTIDLFDSSSIDPYEGRLKPVLTTMLMPERPLSERLSSEPRGTIVQAKEAGGYAFRWLVRLTKRNGLGSAILCYECARLIQKSTDRCPHCGGFPIPDVNTQP